MNINLDRAQDLPVLNLLLRRGPAAVRRGGAEDRLLAVVLAAVHVRDVLVVLRLGRGVAGRARRGEDLQVVALLRAVAGVVVGAAELAAEELREGREDGEAGEDDLGRGVSEDFGGWTKTRMEGSIKTDPDVHFDVSPQHQHGGVAVSSGDDWDLR